MRGHAAAGAPRARRFPRAGAGERRRLDGRCRERQADSDHRSNGIGLAAAEALALVSRFRAMRLQHEKQQ